jgi:hypothetical protein
MATPAPMTMLQLYRHILRAARDFPSVRGGPRARAWRRARPPPCHSPHAFLPLRQVKKHSIIREIKSEFRANQVGPNALGSSHQKGARAHSPHVPGHGGGPRTTPLAAAQRSPAPPLVRQRLTDEGRVRHCRELAERGLSDLQAYSPAARGGGGGDSSIFLKGATQ